MNSIKRKRVVVAMSGGVDSSVAAALLVEQGYEVIGMMMRLWSEPGEADGAIHNRCCTPDQMADARRIAAQLEIPFYVVDVQSYFRHSIVQFFIDEHARGRTPNPCIECNRTIRFNYLYHRARSMDADFLATGHYAQIQATPAGFQLLEGRDPQKDQSYVLHMLTQEHLAHTLFPIGGYAKEEVRALAADFALPVAQKSDSMDLCFLGDGDYRRFLRDHAPAANVPGPIVSSRGDWLGEHRGLAFYTIGQRKGLGINTGEPTFVLRKDPVQNRLVVGPRVELGQTELSVREVSWIAGHAPLEPLTLSVKIRYKAKPAAATVIPGENHTATVRLHDAAFGVTAGQGAVFYDGSVCLGGGIIADREPAGGDLNIPVTTRRVNA